MASATKVLRRRDAFFCSFCGKQQKEVASLIAGFGTFICNECVGLCVAILQADGQALSVPAVEHESLHQREEVGEDELLARMVRVARSHEHIDVSVTQFVKELRERAVTWARIGQALGMTRQSAWERYSGED